MLRSIVSRTKQVHQVANVLRNFKSSTAVNSTKHCTIMVNRKEYILPNNTDVVVLDCKDAFKNLSDQEKLYSHYLSKASWYGSLICLHQTSPEAPGIFLLVHRLFTAQSVASLQEKCLEIGVSEEDFNAFTIYISGFLANMGNYKSFGDTKIVPNISQETFTKIIEASQAYQNSDLKDLYAELKDSIFALDPPKVREIGMEEKGVSTYFSKNCTQEDADLVLKFMDNMGLSPYNTRLFKSVQNDGSVLYTIRLASAETSGNGEGSDINQYLGRHTFENDGASVAIEVVRGDYSPLMQLVCDNLTGAKQHAANDNQRSMIEQYIEAFRQGSTLAHKNGSRFWIKDKGPIVESYIGFIESYRDPTGVRGEFEGFVAVVNKEQSAKFAELVKEAEKFIAELPWPTDLEKDKFLKPDFTSLDVLTFGGSGVPAGINIPNYDDIRQDEGFKNVSLGNVIIVSYKDAKITFLKDSDQEIVGKLKTPSFEVQVGLHELLGHGSGKLLFKKKDGTYNYDHENFVNPLTNEPVSHWYNESESYSGVFSDIGSSYEECRAECVGIYLCMNTDILRIFGHEGTAGDDIVYVNWLNMVRAGLIGLEFYSPEMQKWKQAHMQARYVILRVLLEAGQGLVSVEQVEGSDGKPDLVISLDRTKVHTVGKEAIANFLLKLQVYKSTGDYDGAKALYEQYSRVGDDMEPKFLSFRQIVLDRKQPRKLLVQHNTELKDDGSVALIDYEGNARSMIESHMHRFAGEDVYKIVDSLWKKDRDLL